MDFYLFFAFMHKGFLSIFFIDNIVVHFLKTCFRYATVLFLMSIFFCCENLIAQPYAPPVGVAGTTAIHKDSSIFIKWAQSCTIQRGWIDISDTSLGKANVGNEIDVLGIADMTSVLSLGDGGEAICTFDGVISNGPGYDFAIFENSFNDEFLELAFVEVSSDGIHFFRFPSVSLTQNFTQVGTFGLLDTRNIHNLAGKYRGGWGTPFDLSELPDTTLLNKQSITHIKVIDCIGSIDDNFATYDSQGNKINDPWNTPFPSSGFDLDAIGIINGSQPTSAINLHKDNMSRIFPNPVKLGGYIFYEKTNETDKFTLFNIAGQCIEKNIQFPFNTNLLTQGLYYLQCNGNKCYKIVIQ